MDERQRRVHGRVILAKRRLDARGQPVALVPGGDRRQQVADVLGLRQRFPHNRPDTGLMPGPERVLTRVG